MRLRRRYLVAIGSGVVVFLAYWIVAWIFSSIIITSTGRAYSAEREAEEIQQLGIASVGTPEPVAVVVDDLTIRGSFYANPGDGPCAVVFLHGRGTNRTNLIEHFELFWDSGCHTLIYDGRGSGASDSGFQTYGVLDRGDAIAVVGWVADRTGLRTDQIGLLGASYGAATAIQAAAEMSDLAFVIADSSFADLRTIVADNAERQFGFLAKPFVPAALAVAARRADFDPDQASPVAAAADVKAPLLLIHARDDDETDASHSRAIYAAADPTTTTLAVTDWGAGHVGSYFTEPDRYREIVNRFLAERVASWPTPVSP